MSYITLEGISKKFTGRFVLENVNLEIKKGEIFGLFGPSGCGKTTLLRIIAGLERLEDGKVVLRSKEVCSRTTFLPPEERNVSFIFQDLALWPHMTVREHLEFILDKNPDKIEKILKTLEMEKHINSLPEQLSGGEKQRLAIARSLAQNSDILLLDEPFSSVDFNMKEKMKEVLLNLKKEYDLTFAYVTHDVFDIIDFCDRVAEMKDGRILKVGKPKNIVKRIVSKI
jgi:ABC-type Fe3+/spermidine/putrescine transport system ATPase subunit